MTIAELRKERQRKRKSIQNVTPPELPAYSIPKNPKWFVGITTSHRKEPTLQNTYQSIIQAGWYSDDINIFAEPHSDVPPLPSKIHHNQSRLGGWENMLSSFREGLKSDADLLMYCQDDIRLTNECRAYLKSNWSHAGITSLYTSSKQVFGARWNSYSTTDLVGLLCMVLHRTVAERLVAFSPAYPPRINFDTTFGNWARSQNIPITNHSPSLVYHTGKTSTLHPNGSNINVRQSNTFHPELRYSSVTAILTVYDRDTLESQMLNLKNQSVQPEKIWIFCNNEDRLDECRSIGADRIILCIPNSKFHFRFACAFEAETDYVWILDDDYFPGLAYLENALPLANRNIVVPFGRIAPTTDSYTSSRIITGSSHIGIRVDWGGGTYLFRPRLISHLFSKTLSSRETGEDIQLCLRCKKQGIPTVVPPIKDPSQLGNTDHSFESDSHSSYRQKGWFEERMRIYNAEKI